MTPLQTWWASQLALLSDARDQLDERAWATFVVLLTFRVAALNAAFLEPEDLAA